MLHIETVKDFHGSKSQGKFFGERKAADFATAHTFSLYLIIWKYSTEKTKFSPAKKEKVPKTS
jgi:hypothetical protein